MAFQARSASSQRALLTSSSALGRPNEQFSHIRGNSPNAFDPSNGQNHLFKDPSTLSTNDLNFQKVVGKDNGVSEQTVYEVQIENPQLMRKTQRSELASKKSCLTRVWQTALVAGLVIAALGAGIGTTE